MTIKYTLTSKQYMDIMKLHLLQEKKSFFVAFIVLTFALTLIDSSIFSLADFLLLALFYFASIVLAFVFLVLFFVNLNFKRNKLLHSEREMTFSKEEFRLKTDMCEILMKYSIITKRVQTEKYLLLYITRKSFHAVPLTDLSDDEKEALLLFVQDHKDEGKNLIKKED